MRVCEEFMQRLTAYALRLANGRSYNADDLVQETVCRALLYAANPEKIHNPLGYLLRMMRPTYSASAVPPRSPLATSIPYMIVVLSAPPTSTRKTSTHSITVNSRISPRPIIITTMRFLSAASPFAFKTIG